MQRDLRRDIRGCTNHFTGVEQPLEQRKWVLPAPRRTTEHDHGDLLPSPSALAAGALPAQSPKPTLLSHTHTQLPVTKGARSRWEKCSVSCQRANATSFQTSTVPQGVSMATSIRYSQRHRDSSHSADTPGQGPTSSKQDSQDRAQPLKGFQTNFALLSQGGHSIVTHSGIPHTGRTQRSSCGCHHQLALAALQTPSPESSSRAGVISHGAVL